MLWVFKGCGYVMGIYGVFKGCDYLRDVVMVFKGYGDVMGI